MSRDPDAYKADIEERDRRLMNAIDARARLNKHMPDWAERPREDVIKELLGILSWRDANEALGYLEWDDNRHDGESDP